MTYDRAAIPLVYKMTLKTEAESRPELIEHCLKNNVLGLGWGSHYFGGDCPERFEDYLAEAEACWSVKALGPVRWFHDADPGSLVWFRDLQSRYYLGRLTGEWRPYCGQEAERLDLANVRDVDHETVESEAEVPGDVVRAFAAPRQWAFCKVGDDRARRYSACLASELLGTPRPVLELSTREILETMLGPLDVEDLVAAYLQDRRDYIALPARYAKSTAVYEYVLRSRKTRRTAVVQVKTGNQRVPTETIDRGAADEWFVYTAQKQDDLPSFVEQIHAEDLIAFMESGAPSLPPVVDRWMQWASSP